MELKDIGIKYRHTGFYLKKKKAMQNLEPEAAASAAPEKIFSPKAHAGQFRNPNVPAIEISDGRFTVKIAETRAEREAALRLRYKVFNIELGGEADSPGAIDRDEFDLDSHHLIVRRDRTGETVGVYRLRTLEIAGTPAGFYSATEFFLEDLPAEILQQSVEIGRAAVAKNFRRKNVLFLLWKGLAEYIKATNKRFLFGCCSLFSNDYAEGRAVYKTLETENHLCPNRFVRARENFKFTDKEKLAAAAEASLKKEFDLPHLFRLYLRIGAKVCSQPVIDRDFGTIDFFVIFDVENLDPRYRRVFFEN